jgi:Uma2 family endonuclease
MAIATRPLTYEDLLQTPDDGQRYEIVGGELIVSPAPVPEHQEILGRLFLLFAAFVRRHRLGKVYIAPIDVGLFDHDNVQPDLIFIAADRLGIVGPTRVEGAPDLVLEVLSPGTRHLDQVRKAALYATAGVREYWLVDPEARAIAILALVGQHFEPVPQTEGVGRSGVLPGFEVEIDPLFSDLG